MEFKLATNPDKVLKLLDFLYEKDEHLIVALDTETTGLYPLKDKVVSFNFSYKEDLSIMIPCNFISGGSFSDVDIVRILKSLSRFNLVYHNARFDIMMIKHNFGVDLPCWADTMLYAYVLAESSLGLKNLSKFYFNSNQVEFSELMSSKFGARWKSQGYNFVHLNPNDHDVQSYAGEDAIYTLKLYNKYRKFIHKHNNIISLEEDLLPIVMSMTEHGILVDGSILLNAIPQLQLELDELEDSIYESVGEPFKMNSPKDLSRILFTVLGLPVQKRSGKTGNPSCDKGTFELLSGMHPCIDDILKWRQDTKLISAYLVKIPGSLDEAGYLHNNFNNLGAVSGRFKTSSVECYDGKTYGLNLQNIPVGKTVDVRSAFIAPDGFVFVKADFSQIEYRVLASLAGEKYLIDSFKAGIDFHTLTASLVYNIPVSEVTPELRKVGKMLNFGINYGMTSRSLAKHVGMSEEQAETFVNSYFARVPNVCALIEATKETALTTRESYTFFGRLRKYNFDDMPAKAVEAALRQSYNTTIQGTAADLLKIAMLRVYRGVLRNPKFNGKVFLVNTVHDELDFYVSTDMRDEILSAIKRAMEVPVHPSWAPIVCDISFGSSWSEESHEDWIVPSSFKNEEFVGWNSIRPK